MTGNSLINLGELSKPATVLIEKISDAIGVVYEPTRIKRKAKAEAEVSKILAKTKIEVTEIEERGLQRLIHQEARKQQNIEMITAKAIEELPEDANVKDLDEDWLVYFFDKCDKVSDEYVQTLWAKVLAGEATEANSFSKRTLNTIAMLDKEDAEIFTQFGQFVWHTDLHGFPVIFNLEDDIYRKNFNRFYESISHLTMIGVLTLEINNINMTMLPNRRLLSYFDKKFIFDLKKPENNNIIIGKCMFTTVGKELFKICGAEPNQEFCDYAIEEFKKQGIKVTPV